MPKHDYFLLNKKTIFPYSSSFDPVSSPSNHLLKKHFFTSFLFRIRPFCEKWIILIYHSSYGNFLEAGNWQNPLCWIRTTSQVATIEGPIAPKADITMGVKIVIFPASSSNLRTTPWLRFSSSRARSCALRPLVPVLKHHDPNSLRYVISSAPLGDHKIKFNRKCVLMGWTPDRKSKEEEYKNRVFIQ